MQDMTSPWAPIKCYLLLQYRNNHPQKKGRHQEVTSCLHVKWALVISQ